MRICSCGRADVVRKPKAAIVAGPNPSRKVWQPGAGPGGRVGSLSLKSGRYGRMPVSTSAASLQPAPSGCGAAGEGWAGGPSRRDAQRPSRGRGSRRGCQGWGDAPPLSTSRDLLCPHRVHRWSARWPETADAARQQPTRRVLVRAGFQSQPTAPNRPSDDFARRGSGVRFPSSPPVRPAADRQATGDAGATTGTGPAGRHVAQADVGEAVSRPSRPSASGRLVAWGV